jgi:hypothetical protein
MFNTVISLAREALVIIIVLLCVTMGGCGSSTPESVSMTSIEQARENPSPVAAGTQQFSAPSAKVSITAVKGDQSKVVGVWSGTTVANCAMSARNRCNAEQKVTITLIQDSKLTGYYRCAYGTLNCLNMNETGKVVDAKLNESRVTIRVAMPDATSCLYSGLIANDAVRGGYSCYAGGATIEQGSWQAQRSY